MKAGGKGFWERDFYKSNTICKQRGQWREVHGTFEATLQKFSRHLHFVSIFQVFLLKQLNFVSFFKCSIQRTQLSFIFQVFLFNYLNFVSISRWVNWIFLILFHFHMFHINLLNLFSIFNMFYPTSAHAAFRKCWNRFLWLVKLLSGVKF